MPGQEMRHGGNLVWASRSYGIAVAEWLDLSTGINPRPWPGWTAFGGAELELDRLPSGAALERLLAAARGAYGIPPGVAVVAAPGSEAVIRALPRLVPGRAALSATSYASYYEAWRHAGMSLDTAENLRPAHEPETSLILVNPNNPDGRSLPPAEILALARSRRGGALVIVDEAFADAEIGQSVVPHLAEDDPALVLKSFGKFFGLPGLRLGFAIGPQPLLARLAAAFGDWPVSGPALTVGGRALADHAWQEEARRWLVDQAHRLDEVLAEAGMDAAGGTRLFRLVRHAQAAAWHRSLARRAIWTRVWRDAPELIRFGLPPDDAGTSRLRRALAEAVQG